MIVPCTNRFIYDASGRIRPTVWVFVLALWIVALAMMFSAREQSLEAKEGWRSVSAGDQLLPLLQGSSIGNPATKYTLVEFVDYQCPYCRLARPHVKLLLSEFPAKIHLVIHNLPLRALHPQALNAAYLAAASAEQRKFQGVHDLLLTHDLSPTSIDPLIKEAGVNVARFQSDCRSVCPLKVDADFLLAKKLGVEGTPTFFMVSSDSTVKRFKSLDSVEQFLRKE